MTRQARSDAAADRQPHPGTDAGAHASAHHGSHRGADRRAHPGAHAGGQLCSGVFCVRLVEVCRVSQAGCAADGVQAEQTVSKATTSLSVSVATLALMQEEPDAALRGLAAGMAAELDLAPEQVSVARTVQIGRAHV